MISWYKMIEIWVDSDILNEEVADRHTVWIDERGIPMTDVNMNQRVSVLEYSQMPGIYAIFSDYDRKKKSGILRYIGNGLDEMVLEIIKKYTGLCTINTISDDDTEAYDLDE